MRHFEGRRVLVTGAARGLGRELALLLSTQGANLVLTDRDPTALSETCALIPGAEQHVVDVRDPAAVHEMAQQVLRTGPVDVLVNNAGIGHSGTLEATSLETWQRLIEVNLLGALHHVQAFLPSMKARKQGQIVNISSGQVWFRLPTWGAYSAVKSSLGAWSETLHWELRRYGVEVTTVYPFLIATHFYDALPARTWGERSFQRAMPILAQDPRTVARIVVRAIRRRKGVERVHPVNEIGRLLPLVPPLAALVNLTAERLLAGREEAA